jgi:hypothetical protein
VEKLIILLCVKIDNFFTKNLKAFTKGVVKPWPSREVKNKKIKNYEVITS